MAHLRPFRDLGAVLITAARDTRAQIGFGAASSRVLLQGSKEDGLTKRLRSRSHKRRLEEVGLQFPLGD